MSKSRVLIVEDDAWLAEQHARILGHNGYETAISAHALGAIELVDQFKPDAIVLDVLLTGSTAFALLHEMQSYSDTAGVPVILCTNLAEDILLDDVKGYGVRRILDKTKMEPGDLIVAMKSVLA